MKLVDFWRKEGFEAASRPPPSHSRCASLGDSLPSSPCSGRFRCEKNDTQSFFFATLAGFRRSSSNPFDIEKNGIVLVDYPVFWRRRSTAIQVHNSISLEIIMQDLDCSLREYCRGNRWIDTVLANKFTYIKLNALNYSHFCGIIK